MYPHPYGWVLGFQFHTGLTGILLTKYNAIYNENQEEGNSEDRVNPKVLCPFPLLLFLSHPEVFDAGTTSLLRTTYLRSFHFQKCQECSRVYRLPCVARSNMENTRIVDWPHYYKAIEIETGKKAMEGVEKIGKLARLPDS